MIRPRCDRRGAVLDLPAAHRRQGGVAVLVKRPGAEHAMVIVGCEHGVADSGAIFGAGPADGVESDLHRFVAVAGVSLGFGVESGLIGRVPLGPSQLVWKAARRQR